MANPDPHGTADAIGVIGQLIELAYATGQAADRRQIERFLRWCGDLAVPVDRRKHALGAGSPRPRDDGRLSRRERQTLEQLLAGRSEKEAATALGISRHTLHIYVKRVYRHFGVCSRPELLSLLLTPGGPAPPSAPPPAVRAEAGRPAETRG